ncbi:hypothetical protein CCACVL1_02401 [Corchorus capsularis]|uniref:Uncharacterized protein n=1 Tax=Corchorus capsularis TaxID=210143 RepID=A0A1R3K8U8_COCAP|nr:hypothetical protein CCACVL1_02401 [Corchorus capsularis]
MAGKLSSGEASDNKKAHGQNRKKKDTEERNPHRTNPQTTKLFSFTDYSDDDI